MENNVFKVIEGGQALPFQDREKQFKWAYVTDTRLMGVVFLCMCYEANGPFYQLFYFDAEEFGLESYERYIDDQYQQAVDRMSGGLGGKKVPLTEEEATTLVSSFIQYNLDHNIPMPGDSSEYMQYLTDRKIDASLMGKMVEPLHSSYQLIHYYVMRLFGKDFDAADYLTDGFKSKDYYEDMVGATLCKNTIDKVKDGYMCESVIETDEGDRFIVTSLVNIEDGKVISFEPVNRFRISPEEEALKVGRTEYITLVHYLDDMDAFDNQSTELVRKAMVTEHENGRVFMVFNQDNSHVDQKVFQLNSDVLGVYYITKHKHIILSSFDEENLAIMEKDLGRGKLGSKCRVRQRYEFSNPVLFRFIQSGITDFKEFVKILESE
ncbi:MAG: hypothetical protein MJ146_03845 [Clostridia bacterium]|nr:hypothetical protein [Clostridia bacterium]